MAERRCEDFYDAAAVANTEQLLKGRFDTSLDGLTSTDDERKKVVGLLGQCSNTGYLYLTLAGRVISIIDLSIMNATDQIIPLEIDIPVGQKLSVHEMSTSGTGSCAVCLIYEVTGR